MKTTIARQRGMTLIEVLAALAIGTVLLVGLASLVGNSLDDMKGQQAAYYQAQVVDAARRYLDKNAADVATATPAGTVLPVTLKQLRDGKFLADSFADTNPYRQGTCVLVRRPDPVNYPGQFDALIVTTGGDMIGDKDLPSVAMLAGSGGGYISTTAPGVARGASWQMQTNAFRDVTCPGAPDPALRGTLANDAGHLVSSLFYDGAAQQAADFLYRIQIDGKPQLNTMAAPVRFGGAGLVAAGDPCEVGGTPAAGVAIDAVTRAVLTCGTDGNWSLPGPWKAPVPDHPALLAVADPQPGDVRMVTSLGRAFTFNSAREWKPLAVDQDGNLDVPLTLTANKVLAQQEVESKGTVHSFGHMTTEQDLHVKQNVFVKRDVTVDHALYAKGVEAEEWMSAPAVYVHDTYDYGTACNYYIIDPFDGVRKIAYPMGTIVTDNAHRLMICGKDSVFIYIDEQQNPKAPE